ncbi:11722_t:CDS:2 [Entrophospora sp. SA101]|nr:11718_t:CDS:2 [Entrophospora sp. SA101]CAJ0843803.1 11722_t:CDS:2 [Entrophospora sp. SA101]
MFPAQKSFGMHINKELRCNTKVIRKLDEKQRARSPIDFTHRAVGIYDFFNLNINEVIRRTKKLSLGNELDLSFLLMDESLIDSVLAYEYNIHYYYLDRR